MKKYGVLILFVCLFIFLACNISDNLNEFSGVKKMDFHIINPPKWEVFEINSSNRIQWYSKAGESIKIDLYKDGKFLKTIAYKAKNTGEYNWITGDEEESNLYNIKFTVAEGIYAGQGTKSSDFTLGKWQDLQFPLSTGGTLPSVHFDGNGKLYITFHTGSIEDVDYRIHLHSWNNGRWSDNLCDESFESFTYNLQFDENQNPVMIYGKFPQEKDHTINCGISTHIKKYINSEWVDYYEDFKGLQDCGLDETLEPAAFKMDLSGGNPVVFYLTPNKGIPDGQNGITSWDAEAWYIRGKSYDPSGLGWIPMYSGESIKTIKLPVPIGDITNREKLYKFFMSINNEVSIDSTGRYFIAYSDTQIIDNNDTNFRTFGVSVSENDGWKSIGDYMTESESSYFSMTTGLNDKPVIAYLLTTGEDNSVKHSAVEVIEWVQDQDWQSVGTNSFISRKDQSPSIYKDMIGDKEVLILAYSEGVKIWDGSTWEDMGFPVRQTGDPSWYIGSNDEYWAIAFIDSNDNIRVKIRYKTTEEE